ECRFLRQELEILLLLLACGLPNLWEARGLNPRLLTPNDVVPFDNCRYAYIGRRSLWFHFAIDADNPAVRPHKNLGALRNFGGKRQRKIQFCAGSQFLLQCKVNSACRNISRLPIVRRLFVDGNMHNYGKRQIVAAGQTTLSHPQGAPLGLPWHTAILTPPPVKTGNPLSKLSRRLM